MIPTLTCAPRLLHRTHPPRRTFEARFALRDDDVQKEGIANICEQLAKAAKEHYADEAKLLLLRLLAVGLMRCQLLQVRHHAANITPGAAPPIDQGNIETETTPPTFDPDIIEAEKRLLEAGGAPTPLSLWYVWRFAFGESDAISVHDLWWCEVPDKASQGPVLLDVTSGTLHRATTKFTVPPWQTKEAQDCHSHSHIVHVQLKDPFDGIGIGKPNHYATTTPVVGCTSQSDARHVTTAHFKGLVNATAATDSGRVGDAMWKDCATKVYQTLLACINTKRGCDSSSAATNPDSSAPATYPFGSGHATLQSDHEQVKALLHTTEKQERGDGLEAAVHFRSELAELFPTAVLNMMRIIASALRLVCKILEEATRGAEDVLHASVGLPHDEAGELCRSEPTGAEVRAGAR